jgi:hypothetical protein
MSSFKIKIFTWKFWKLQDKHLPFPNGKLYRVDNHCKSPDFCQKPLQFDDCCVLVLQQRVSEDGYGACAVTQPTRQLRKICLRNATHVETCIFCCCLIIILVKVSNNLFKYGKFVLRNSRNVFFILHISYKYTKV